MKALFKWAFSISNIKAGFAKCSIYTFDPKAIDQSKIMQGSSSLSESNSSTIVSSLASFDTSCVVPCLDDSDIPSINPSPIVSTLSSHVDESSLQVPLEASPHTSIHHEPLP